MNGLPSEAEQRADQARNLNAFSEFSLPGVRSQVSQLLGMIGRSGIFATYTLHDISHIDAMLRMLNWLIPQQTKDAMTPADWLLTVLAIYFHDLGMLVPEEEFIRRNETRAFVNWFEGLQTTEGGTDFLARTKRMSPDEKDRFFFQEYIRIGHAARIREWITGRFSSRWPPGFETAAMLIHTLIRPLPPRFRDYLAAVCESHHSDELENTSQFPLFAPVGSSPAEESVNVQYAALLLRTADLLHVTNDRTPSQAFQLIRFTDPKSVDEWVKQMGAFAVAPKKRDLDLSDPDSSNILVYADFDQEPPFFALQEYIVYANQQVAQSRRWAKKSELDKDGANYVFPWSSVESDVRFQGTRPEKLKFQLDRGKLLDLLVGHTLYNEPTVAIRELLQNAIDAVRYQHHVDQRAHGNEESVSQMGAVRVEWDPSSRILSIDDDGIGMDVDVIKNHLMMVGSSFYNTPRFRAANKDFSPISRFGIGVLTCFMISDDIEILTRRDQRTHRIRMTSVHAEYILQEIPEDDHRLDSMPPHGTRVTVTIRESVNVSKPTLYNIVQHWVILPECRVDYRERGGDTQRIGFSSAADALTHYLRDARDEKRKEMNGVEALTKTFGKEDKEQRTRASYELAYGVESGWFPEKAFVKDVDDGQPMVCVEGIRVSDRLPWMGSSSEDRICGLLSVRGDHRVQTTVSRSDLEQDTSYHELGQICLDLLMEHIDDEVHRIAKFSGEPLSQAAAAGVQLCWLLAAAVSGEPGTDAFQKARRELPMLVVERLNSGPSGEVDHRSLDSLNGLIRATEFWTVESRLVNSLAILSNDLGIELSVNGSLTKLAPSFTQLQYSPLVPEAHHFRTEFTTTHKVAKLEFSRRFRQTAIKWRQLEADNESTIFQSERLEPSLWRELYLSARAGRRRATVDQLVWIAPIQGDESEIDVAITRMGAVLAVGSDVAEEWTSIYRGFQYYHERKAVTELKAALNAATAYRRLRLRERKGLSVMSISGHDTRRDWETGVRLLNAALESLGAKDCLPVELEAVEHRRVFDVRAYWRDRGPDAEDEG